jgi:hypothetical protein
MLAAKALGDAQTWYHVRQCNDWLEVHTLT